MESLYVCWNWFRSQILDSGCNPKGALTRESVSAATWRERLIQYALNCCGVRWVGHPQQWHDCGMCCASRLGGDAKSAK
jgi:hypothetical protein